MADKHIITFGIQSPIFQIVNDGIANYGEQRQCINLLCFLLCMRISRDKLAMCALGLDGIEVIQEALL